MPFSPCSELSRQAERTSRKQLQGSLLIALLAPSLMFGSASDAPDSPSPAVDSSSKDAAVVKNPKKLDKYDIDHIGQRGIGHGFNLYSLKREHELGENIAASIDRTTKIITDPIVNDYVNRLAQKIIRYSDAEIPFTVKVMDSGDIPRAYGLPGGFLYVDSALILSADGEAELATVLAHEIAHVAARHATRALSRREVCHIVDSVAYIAGPAGAGFADVGGIAGPLSVKKFARDSEYEADLLGMEYAYAAGYDPQALLDALEKLHVIEVKKKADMTKIPGYRLVTHIPFHSKIANGFASYPQTEERIERLQSEIVTFLPARKDYIVDTNEFEEVKSHLLASQAPRLRHHPGDEDNKGPVLRRSSDDNVEASSPLLTFPKLAFRPH